MRSLRRPDVDGALKVCDRPADAPREDDNDK
jgi:hypothetical protein